jgi:hypothetical protein
MLARRPGQRHGTSGEHRGSRHYQGRSLAQPGPGVPKLPSRAAIRSTLPEARSAAADTASHCFPGLAHLERVPSGAHDL